MRLLKRPRPPSQVPFEMSFLAPVGVRDSVDAASVPPDMASEMVNMYPLPQGGAWSGRPGYAPASLDVGIGGAAQGIFRWVGANGPELMVVSGGGMWSYTNGELTAGSAHANPGDLPLSATARMWFAQFGNGVVISDGINKPIYFDPTKALFADRFKQIPCPPLYGKPQVYYGKLFGIRADNRREIVWSDEGLIFEGYVNPGRNNAWDLRQTSTENLTALFATNEGLYYFRERSIGLIMGAISEEFRAAGTTESVSQTLGTKSPGTVVGVGRDIWFMDADYRPQILIPGGGIKEPAPWENAANSIKKSNGNLFHAVATEWVELGVVVYSYQKQAKDNNTNDTHLLFQSDTGQFVGAWDLYMDVMDHEWLEDNRGVPRLVFLSAGTLVHRFGVPSGNVWRDTSRYRVSATAMGETIFTIEHVVQGPFHGWDSNLEKTFTRVDLLLSSAVANTQLSMSGVLPYGEFGQTPPFSEPGKEELVWDSSKWDQPVGNPIVASERKLTVGVRWVGRWAKLRLTHKGSSERFTFAGWTLHGMATGKLPGIR